MKIAAEAFELIHALHQSNTRVNAVPLSDVPVTIDWDSSTLSAELDKANVRFAELESTEPITVH